MSEVLHAKTLMSLISAYEYLQDVYCTRGHRPVVLRLHFFLTNVISGDSKSMDVASWTTYLPR
jgi:hypothetical protein